jgi:Flp pilus assembly protein TadG
MEAMKRGGSRGSRRIDRHQQPICRKWLSGGYRYGPRRFEPTKQFNNEFPVILAPKANHAAPKGFSMPWFVTATAPVRPVLRRFRRNRRGSAAIEFALVAPVFFGLLFAILETALSFLASQVMESAAQDSARLIMTGQAQNLGYTRDQFKDQVCNRLIALFADCTHNVKIDVQNYPAFSSVNINSQIDASGNFIDNMKYCPGQAQDIVVVRVFWQWPLFVTGLGYDISNLAGQKRLLVATAAFRNEPFTGNLPCS